MASWGAQYTAWAAAPLQSPTWAALTQGCGAQAPTSVEQPQPQR